MKLIDQTENLLNELRLNGIKAELARRLRQAQDETLGHEDFLNLILCDEAQHRKDARIKRLLKNAAFRQSASAEGLDFASPRGLDKKQIMDLAGGRFIRDGLNVIILGPTGIGKTHLATAIGNAACRNGQAVAFYRMNALIEQTALARAKGTYLNLLRRLSATELLILDDFGIKPLAPQQYQDLYDILDERGEGKSTILTSQVPVANWAEVIPDPVTCEAVTDRLASRAIIVQMRGGSYRKKHRLPDRSCLTIDPS